MKNDKVDYTQKKSVRVPALKKIAGDGRTLVNKNPTAAGGYALIGGAFSKEKCLEVLFFHGEAVHIRRTYFRSMTNILKEGSSSSRSVMLAKAKKAWNIYKHGNVHLYLHFVRAGCDLEINIADKLRKKYTQHITEFCIPKVKPPPKPPTTISTSSGNTTTAISK